MSSIVLRVRELYERVSEMKSDGCDYVELEIIDSSKGEPAFIHFDCISVDAPGALIDYEELEEVPKGYLP
ncbi:MAG: hypothetical protein PUJ55_10805 [Clostridiales bacterium]|nr:hypothetical protein [Roseburia sp.]MDD7637410.1 hypothetical protein [Clostridiales bacterium]MDY4111968.1 hypothetical protein [Roseburia sp.]